MTEPNKELPKEVESMEDKILQQLYLYHYSFEVDDLPKEAYGVLANKLNKMFIEAKDKQLSEKDATISKLMGLLKGKLVSSSLDDLIVRAKIKRIDINTAIDEYWADYCKENGIDLGGE